MTLKVNAKHADNWITFFLGSKSFCRNVIYISEHELEASWTWSLWMDNKDSHTHDSGLVLVS